MGIGNRQRPSVRFCHNCSVGISHEIQDKSPVQLRDGRFCAVTCRTHMFCSPSSEKEAIHKKTMEAHRRRVARFAVGIGAVDRVV